MVCILVFCQSALPLMGSSNVGALQDAQSVNAVLLTTFALGMAVSDSGQPKAVADLKSLLTAFLTEEPLYSAGDQDVEASAKMLAAC